jgi:uncharacterized membrane protein
VAIKIGKYRLHFHSMSVHFTCALYPVSLFFLILAYFYNRDASLFTYFHLMILAAISVPVSYITGIIEWKVKYKGARVRIFTAKYRWGLVLFALGAVCTVWYGLWPGVLKNAGAPRTVFLLVNVAILPLVIYLGYLGGKIVFAGGH